MTIEEAVKFYNFTKDNIECINTAIKKLIPNNNTSMLSPMGIDLSKKEAQEIAEMLIDYKKKLENDLKEEFK